MDGSELRIERHVPARRAVVWEALSRPEHLAQWWIPKPIECRVLSLDLRPGGGFQTEMRQPGEAGFQPHLDACVLEVSPGSRLVWTTVMRAGWQPVDPWLALTAILSLADEGTGTRYAARVLHRSPEDSRRHAELGFEAGWGTVLDQLAAFVAGRG